MTRVAAVTMVYNEGCLLPVWVKYYSSHFGAENCYVIDHGSSDGSTDHLGAVNVVRIPRSPKDNDRRTRFVSEFCTSLTDWYDTIINTDVDEIVVLDPEAGISLLEYCSAPPQPCITAIGLDVYHIPDSEPDLDFSAPITLQRHYVRFSSSMCKPVLTTGPIQWAPGFHSSNYPVLFDSLYLFHLRYADLKEGLRRLHGTRTMQWASENAGSHQRVSDGDFEQMIRYIGLRPSIDDATLRPDDEPLADYLVQVLRSEKSANAYRIDLHIFGDRLWRIPQRFTGTF